MHSLVAGLLAFALAAPPFVTVPQSHPQGSERRASGDGFDNYQIPAGTALLLELRTPFDSASAKVDDEIEATLWSPVIQGGVELIPAKSLVTGKISAAVRASKQTPIGSVTFTMSVVQHLRTSDRAMIRTQRIVMEAPVEPAPVGGGNRKLKPRDIAMAEGSRFVAVTSEPLIVRIPK
jgi:hypothetical protein